MSAERLSQGRPAARRILVTGSAQGIGAGIAAELSANGHHVVRHCRTAQRAEEVLAGGAGSGEVLVGDLASLASTRDLARQIADSGPFDAVVHNAGWAAPAGGERLVTVDGVEVTFQVNVLSIYALLASAPLPTRVVLVSSDSIRKAHVDVDDLQHATSWDAGAAYADSKLAATAVVFALARRRREVLATACHPGWVRTRMSAGSPAPLSIPEGADTPAWLAASDDPAAGVSGGFYIKRQLDPLNRQAEDEQVQDALLAACEQLTGLGFPGRGTSSQR